MPPPGSVDRTVRAADPYPRSPMRTWRSARSARSTSLLPVPGGTAARLVAALGVGIVLAAVPAAPAGAHATLVGTAPAADAVVEAPPDQVELRFDEPVEAVAGAVRVFGPDGDRVDDGAAELSDGDTTVRAAIDAVQRGTHTVAWRVTSEDSHTISGSFVFHVGARTGAVAVGDSDDAARDVVGGVGRWLGFAGALVAAGAAGLAAVATTTRAGEDGASDRLRRLAGAAALVGVVGVLAALVADLAHSAGRGLAGAVGLVPDLAPDTRTGRLALTRAGFGTLAAAAALVVPVWRRSPLPAAVAAGAALVTASLAGHAWTAPARGLAVGADAVHLGAVAVWAGGLVALLVALPAARDRGRLARRFSALALGAVGVVAVSGTVSGWQQVRSIEALTSTGYGQLLLVKVAAFGALAALGWVNRTRLVPLVERTITPLTRSLRAEVVVAAAVLALTTSLVGRAPARATVSEPFEATVEADGGVVDVVVDPARAGANDLHLTFFTDGPTRQALAVDAVQVTAATTGVPARRLEVTPVSPNHVVVAGASLPSAGAWTVEVTAVREGAPLAFTFEVAL